MHDDRGARKARVPTESSRARDERGPRLHVYLSHCGVASRRTCETYIAEGRVKVDGRVVRRPGTTVGTGSRVEVDGRLVHPQTQVYLAVNKPAGYVCSNTRADGHPIVSDLFRGQAPGRLFHVGRLDALSTGLILYTNDGDFAHAVSHPSRQVEKVYQVDTVDPVQEETLRTWGRGVVVDGVRYSVRGAALLSPTRLELTLVEGRNREIRRIMEAFRLRVRRVHRVRIGPVTVRGLRPGEYRRLTDKEVRSLSAR